MQAIIFAAGEGKRLQPLTDDVPKPMVRICGKPILEYTLRALPQAVHEIIFVVGYKEERVREYFGDSFGRFFISYAVQTEPKGTSDALLRAKPFLKNDTFLLLYGDDLYDADDIEQCAAGGPCVLAHETEYPERFGVCLVKDNYLTGILEKQKNPPTNLVNIGAYFLNQSIFHVPAPAMPNGELNLAAQIGAWAQTTPVRVLKAKFWHPINYPESIVAAKRVVPYLR